MNERPQIIGKNQNIRVGLVRCDTHGLYYGALMAEHDPLVLQRPSSAMKKKYPGAGWMTGGNHMYFYSRYGHPREMTAPFVGGFEISRLWDQHRDAAEMAAQVFFGKPKVCDGFEEVSDDVDLVFIADCGGDGSDHLELARPGLQKGVPTFVDKPFADNTANCRAILELSRKHDAPVFSLSILRVEPAVARFRNRIPEVGEVNFATIQGGGTKPAGLVHAISITQHLFGPGIEAVQVLVAPKHTSVHLDYGDRPDCPKHGVMINCDVGTRPHSALAVGIYGTNGDIHAVVDDFTHPAGAAEIVKMIKQMVLTRTAPPLMDEVLESIAVIEAFDKARETGRPAPVENVYRARNV
jgi:predicted dehydrogenase